MINLSLTKITVTQGSFNGVQGKVNYSIRMPRYNCSF